MKLILLCTLAGLAIGAAELRGEDKKEKAPMNASTKEVAVIKTSEGEMVAEFWPEVAPKTVENFKKLAREGFYDGTAFHRVIKGFMIQGGDPLTKDESKQAAWGTGDPGYKVAAEFNDKSHTRGVLSMARSQDPEFGRQPVLHLPRQPELPRPSIHGVRQADQRRRCAGKRSRPPKQARTIGRKNGSMSRASRSCRLIR